MKNTMTTITRIAAAASMVASGAACAADISGDTVKGSFNSTFTVGAGMRAQKQDCALVGDTRSACGSSANEAQWSAGDDGNLNYNKGDFFTAYLKGAHELVLRLPQDITFMARGSWLKDFKAQDTRRSDLSDDAKDQIVTNAQLLDLWASKQFALGEGSGRVRIGNQVVNWGESLFGLGGINATNAYDLQRLLVPGTQVKEAILPAPMINVAANLGGGVNAEAYLQHGWKRVRFAPAGAYFSVADYYDKGRRPVGFSTANFNLTGPDGINTTGGRGNLTQDQEAAAMLADGRSFPYQTAAGDITPRKSGQGGVSLHWKPQDSLVDLGAYYVRYHDQLPVLEYNNAAAQLQWRFLENREVYGLSANTQIGNWALGTELSYRPKEAIALSGCFNAGGPLDANTNGAAVGNCPAWIDQKKFQWHLTGMLQLQPAEHKAVLDLLGADTAFLSTELVVIHFPGMSANKRFTRTIDGVAVDQVAQAAYGIWLDPTRSTVQGAGTATSAGYVVDFNWTYDGKLISGWQVTPGFTFSHSFHGDTPTFLGNYLQGAKALNLYVLFNQNPAVWQAGVNLATYFGGKPKQPGDVVRQLYRDRDFIGAFVSRSF